MNVVILGREGLLGSDMLRVLSARPDFQVESFTHAGFDITDYARVRDSLPKVDAVVNCAGERLIEDAERDRKGMFDVNMKGVRNLAMVCKRNHSLLVHFSSHYVFDGEKQKKYTERDTPNPLNIYGASKLAGDMEVRAVGGDYLIVRTQSLFGPGGPCFINDLIERLGRNEEIRVPDDEVIAPTYTAHLAGAVGTLVSLRKRGIVNVASTGEASRHEIALWLAKRLGSSSTVVPVKAREIANRARRPLYSVLDSHWFRMWTGADLPDWKAALEEYLKSRGA